MPSNVTRISKDAERYIGMRFLRGDSVADIAQHFACSNRAIESVLRQSMAHLIESKRPEPRAEADALVNLTAGTQQEQTEAQP